MDNTEPLDPSKPLPPELTPERMTVDGHSLFRFTFRRLSPDLSDAFYQLVSRHLALMGFHHITIHCPDGYPTWLTKLLRKFESYGLPVEVTPEPTDPELIAAVEAAVGERYDPLKWPSDSALDRPVDAESERLASALIERLRGH